MLRSSIIKEVETCSICYEDMKSATCHRIFELDLCGVIAVVGWS